MFQNIVFIISLAFFSFINVTLADTQTSSTVTKANAESSEVDSVPEQGYDEVEERDEMFNEKERSEQALEVTNAWARSSLSSNNNSAAYMTINNTTNKQITILGAAATDVANNIELHKSFIDEKGVSRMTSIDKIVVPAKSAISLAPGDIHIMLFELKRKLNVGDRFKIVLSLEDMDAITVDAQVK